MHVTIPVVGHNACLTKHGTNNRLMSYWELRDIEGDFMKHYSATGMLPTDGSLQLRRVGWHSARYLLERRMAVIRRVEAYEQFGEFGFDTFKTARKTDFVLRYDNGTKKKKGHRTFNFDVEPLILEYFNGKSIQELSQNTGISTSTIVARMKEYGVLFGVDRVSMSGDLFAADTVRGNEAVKRRALKALMQKETSK